MVDLHKELAQLRSNLQSAEIHPDDRELLEEFDREMQRNPRMSDVSLRMHLQHMKVIAEHRSEPTPHEESDVHGSSLQSLLEDLEAVKDVLDWIENRTWNGKPLKEKTKTHYRTAIRVFARELLLDGPREELPPSIQYIHGGDSRTRREKDVTPDPSEILFWIPHMVDLLDACQNSRDRAMLALAWDSGARPWELKDLTWGDVAVDNGFVRISIGGKDHPRRDPLCVVATPYVLYWLRKDHPANDTDEGFTSDTSLWPRLDENTTLSNSRVATLSSEVGEEAGFEESTNWRRFRKSRASVLAMQGMTRDELETRFGWDPGSPSPAHYITHFGGAVDHNIATRDGMDPEYLPTVEQEDVPDPAPVQCPSCDEWTPRHLDSCLWCSTEFDLEGAVEADAEVVLQEEARLEEKRDRFYRHIVEDSVTPENLEVALRFGDLLDGNEDAVEKAKELRDAIEGDRSTSSR